MLQTTILRRIFLNLLRSCFHAYPLFISNFYKNSLWIWRFLRWQRSLLKVPSDQQGHFSLLFRTWAIPDLYKIRNCSVHSSPVSLYPNCGVSRSSAKSQNEPMQISGALFSRYLLSLCNFALQLPAASALLDSDLHLLDSIRPLCFTQDPLPCFMARYVSLGRKPEWPWGHLLSEITVPHYLLSEVWKQSFCVFYSFF